MQNSTAGEMTAQPVQRAATEELLTVALPQTVLSIGAADPLLVPLVDVDGCIEAATPVAHSAVEMWVGNGYGLDAPQVFHCLDCILIQKADAVPEYVPFRGPYKNCPLSNREGGLGADSDQARLKRLDLVVMSLAELLRCNPLLPVWTHILSLIHADLAVTLRRRGTEVILRATRGTHPVLSWPILHVNRHTAINTPACPAVPFQRSCCSPFVCLHPVFLSWRSCRVG
mmetsp:Transcript_8010/g.23696  ORF Transcript_8010/g.23696 Transcript_8010/m.23696 type:complete len:228 (+) Transcript_8010:2463-3146(+)